MRKLSTLLFAALLFLLTGISGVSAQEILTGQLQEQMQSVDKGELIRINIRLKDQYDSQNLIREAQSLTGEARRQYVVSVLKDYSALSQRGVVAELNQLQRSTSVQNVKTFWIANVINCYASPEAIKLLAQRDDIANIDYDEYRVMLDPNENKNAMPVTGKPGSREITWNVLKINADDVWALGFNGEGIIVAVIDTGVNYDHEDLADHVWESDEYPNHGYDFVNNDNDPKDDHGHGTHCSGTVAGDGTAGSQTGVAPEATIMCLKVLDSGGGGSESGVWSAVEFSVEQGAHVMSLSLGWLHEWGVNRPVWRQTFDNSLAAGIVASVAAGNEGDQQSSYPIPDNVRTPGDCPPPWLNPDQTLVGGISGVICVGSTTSSNQLSSFSGRGPLDWADVAGYNDYPYNPELGLIRPDLCAPGSNIKSLAHYNNTGYEAGWSGTSMATPAYAGMIALMLQKNALLSPAQISQISEESTLVLTPGKNNNTGSGLVDALAAFEAVPLPGPSYYAHAVNDASGNNNGELDPEESILLTLSMGNFSDEPASDVTVVLSTDNEYITFTDDSEYFGDFSLEDIIEMEDAFAFDVANNIPGGSMVNFTISASNNTDIWESGFSITANGVLLMMGNMIIDDASGNNNGNLDPGETVDIMMDIMNDGQLDASSAMATISSTNPLLTINSGTFDLGTLEAGQSVEATFNITVDASAPIGSSVDLNLEVVSGYYILEKMMYLKVGLIIEDFETGDFSKFNWEFDGDADWSIVGNEVYEGSYAAKSGSISDQSETELVLPIEIVTDDSVAFYLKVSSEDTYDFLRFYIDGDLQDEWSGEVAWSRATYSVPEGEHSLRWSYEKDQSVAGGDDCAWIDYILMPAIIDETMSANAGGDTEICEGMDYETTASGQNYESLMWGTSGDGSFDDNTMMDATYMPGTQDLEDGMVTLSLTVYGGGDEISDEMELTFLPLPEDAGVISGLNLVCQGWTETYSIDELPNADSYQWIVEPAEAAFEMMVSGHEVDITWEPMNYAGEATITVQGINDCGEGIFSQEFDVMIDICSGINDVNNLITSITPNPNNGYFTLSTEVNEGLIEIVDLTGKVVYTQNISSMNTIIDASALREGLYFITTISKKQKNVKKLIIQK